MGGSTSAPKTVFIHKSRDTSTGYLELISRMLQRTGFSLVNSPDKATYILGHWLTSVPRMVADGGEKDDFISTLVAFKSRKKVILLLTLLSDKSNLDSWDPPYYTDKTFEGSIHESSALAGVKILAVIVKGGKEKRLNENVQCTKDSLLYLKAV